MVGQLIRAVEAPISLSITVARKGAVFAGRVAGWALTETMRQLSPDRPDESFPPVVDEHPAEPASSPTWEPVAEDHASASAMAAQREMVFVAQEEPEREPVDRAEEPGREPVDRAEEPGPGPVDRPEAQREPVGGEDRAVVEHEPGIGASVPARDPHSPLNNPVTEADMTEWPDPYDHREDPRGPGEEMVFGGESGHTQTGATSTSEPHPSQDPEAESWEGPRRDKVDR